MTGLRFAVYAPPEPGLPFLAATILSDGGVIVVPCRSAAEAQHQNKITAGEAEKFAQTLRHDAEGEDGGPPPDLPGHRRGSG